MTSPATVTPGPAPDPAGLLRRWRAGGQLPRQGPDAVTHVERLPARDGVSVPWPDWVPDQLRAALAARGVDRPWQHQAYAAELARAGRHVVVATGTGSGKSLAYLLPALATLLADPRATVLYLAPTKALAADQLRTVAGLGLDGVRPACYDGDTPQSERAWIRQHARFVLTNPDMLHRGILPGHNGWSQFLRRLTYVIVDECHSYRGVFGSHVAHVLRRLRRQTERYGRVRQQAGVPAARRGGVDGRTGAAGRAGVDGRAGPTFVLASATSGAPEQSAGQLTGLPVTAVTEDGAPRGAVTFALWEPPLLPGARADTEDLTPARRSALRESADLLADAVSAGVRTLAFVRSRRGAEVVATTARRALDEAVPGLGARVAAYRAGFLAEERRALERSLASGELLGMATTNALELGVDLVGLDAVLICGYPGTRASLWQQAGRAGRAGREALAVLIARDDPLDTYLVHHPEAVFGRPVEATVLDPTNPYVLGPQLCCAAAEGALTSADVELFGGAVVKQTLDELVAAGLLRRRPTGWYWTAAGRPDVDLRGEGGAPVQVVEEATGRLLGTVDPGSSHFLVHPGAVYLHQGVSYVVDDLDLADAYALVHAEEPDWSTHAREVTSLSVVSVREYRDAGPVGLFVGDVDVTSQIVSYQRRRIGSGEVLDTRPLDLPARQLRTVAVWFTASPAALAAAGIDPADVPGALHAAEHAAIGLLPLVATCDRWDIGGLSTASHADTEAPTVFVYDGHPGGAGFAERAYRAARTWLGATRDLIAACGCETGCPSCVQSPKCGNGNNPLGKADAVRVLDVVLTNLPQTSADQPSDPG
ncbi:DEAD/DEAH box helicase [Solwaraspora sp. WMMA2056]|uniref:DEAD/DEAH box helicase n=1 Tax=Solwaraspora sp. WMMA2056 TaxID=3015161 RepID=UPI00259AEFD0|nr:DEAD/DEAH box helicase [Solwaraspora sp. WMMA2056]WJK42026.1 DEAD/DEAH box helicase [Solwaraspora sp. WMMA2056]